MNKITKGRRIIGKGTVINKNYLKDHVHNKKLELLLEGLLHTEIHSKLVPDFLGPLRSDGVDIIHSISDFPHHFYLYL